MKENEAITALRRSFRVNESGNGTYIVGNQTTSGFDILGIISFSNGRLTRASRDWASSHHSEVVTTIKALVNLLQNQFDRGQSVAIIVPEPETRTPQLTARIVKLFFGKRQVSIQYYDAASQFGGAQATVSEIIEREK